MGCGSSRETTGTLVTEADVRRNAKPEVYGNKNIKSRENRPALSPKSLQIQPPYESESIPLDENDVSIKSMIEKRSILSSLDHSLLVKKISSLDKKTLVDLLLGTDLIVSTDLDDSKNEEDYEDESKAENVYPKMKTVKLESDTDLVTEISLVSENKNNLHNSKNEVNIGDLNTEENVEALETVDSPNGTNAKSKFSHVKKKIEELALISKELVAENVPSTSSSNVTHFADVANMTKAPLKLLSRRNKAMTSNIVNNYDGTVTIAENVPSNEDYSAQRILQLAKPSSSIDYLSSSELIKPNRDSAVYDYGGSRALPYEVTVDSNYHNSIGSHLSATIESRNFGNSTMSSIQSSGNIATSAISSSKNTDYQANYDVRANTYPTIAKAESGHNKSLNVSNDGGNSRFNEYSRLIQLSDKELYEEYTKCTHLVNAGTTFNSKHELCLGIVKYKFHDRLIIQKKSSVMIVDGNETSSNSNNNGNKNYDMSAHMTAANIDNKDVSNFIDKAYLLSKNVDDAHDQPQPQKPGENKLVDVSTKVINRSSSSSIPARRKSASAQNSVSAIAKTGSSLNNVKGQVVKSESDRNRLLILKKRESYIADKVTPLFPSNSSVFAARDSSDRNVSAAVPKKIQQLLQQKGKFGSLTALRDNDARKPKGKFGGTMLSPIAVDNTSSPNYISY